MVEFDTVKPTIKQIIKSFQADRTLLLRYPKTDLGSTKITIKNLEDLSCNHLFDDHPELFNIKRIDALRLRAYIQKSIINRDREHEQEIKQEFQELLED